VNRLSFLIDEAALRSYLLAMLDTIIRGGQVVTPQGAGAWDIGIEGERIAVLGLPGSLGDQAGRIIDATGKIVVPGGVDPHCHLAHSIMSHPDDPGLTMGPEDDTRGMAHGGTTTHIDFAYVQPGTTIQDVVEARAARWKNNSHTDYAFHVTLCGHLGLEVFDQIPDAIKSGFPSYKVFTTNILPPDPRRIGNKIDFGRIGFAMEKVAAHGGLMVVHGEDDDLVQFNYERFKAEDRMEGTNMHLVHSKVSEDLAFHRITTLARSTGAAVYFVHTSAEEGVKAIAEARANGQPVYGETLHQYCCFNAEYYKQPRGFCSHTYPSLKFPEDQLALWTGLVKGGLATLATDEYPTTLEKKLRGKNIDNVTGGNVGAEARMGIAWSEGVVKRGMTLERFAQITSTNAAKIFGLYPNKGAIAAGSDADIVFIDPEVKKTLTKDDFHVTDYSPWEGWEVSGWPVFTMLRGKVIVEDGRLFSDTSYGRQFTTRKIDTAVLERPLL
jgi:dihydropyrimidinase